MVIVYLLLLFPLASIAEIYIDVGHHQVEHAWRGPDNVATWQPKMNSFGITYAHNSGFAIRGAYGVLNQYTSKDVVPKNRTESTPFKG